MATEGVARHESSKKRWLPLVIGVAAFILWRQYAALPSADPVNCDIDVAADTVDVVMLSASWCGYCRRARGFFVKKEIPYCEYDIELSERGAALYADSRFGAIPVIYIDDEVVVGFNRDEITQSLIANDHLSMEDY